MTHDTSALRSIPFLDLVSLHADLENEFVDVFRSALRSGGFIGGPMVERFESDFASFCGTRYSVGVGSGTDALRFAIMAAGINKGDTVLTVANTFIATTEAITQAGAIPEFVDIDPRTFNLDPVRLTEHLEDQCEYKDQRLVSRKTGNPVTAIIPVHLYGQTADMEPILELAQRYNLVVIEDACQAQGAEYYFRQTGEWKKAGSMGRVSAFSFYPGKNLGAFGEAGAITTDDEEIAKNIKMLRDHGQAKKYVHAVEGYNGRLDAIQAGVLQVKLQHLSEWNETRRQNAMRYNEHLSNIEEIVIPFEPDWAKSVYHLYVIRTANREALQKYLGDDQIATGLHYPIPLHLQEAYAWLGYKQGDFPVTEQAANEILSLPMSPLPMKGQQERIAKTIRSYLHEALNSVEAYAVPS